MHGLLRIWARSFTKTHLTLLAALLNASAGPVTHVPGRLAETKLTIEVRQPENEH
jgi:hypothetical protein